MDPEQPVPGIGDGHLVSDLTDEAIDAYVGVAGPGSGSPMLLSEIRHLGGALGRASENAGALAKLDAGYAMYSVGMPMSPELAEAIPAHLRRIEEEMGPWSGDGRYFNFTESPTDLNAILPAETCERLAKVKRSWDPDGMILANHALAAAPA
jgi:hypothetical protein